MQQAVHQSGSQNSLFLLPKRRGVMQPYLADDMPFANEFLLPKRRGLVQLNVLTETENKEDVSTV